jgi:hypothetical protein
VTDSGALPSATAGSTIGANAQSPMLFSLWTAFTGTYSIGPGCALNSTISGAISPSPGYAEDFGQGGAIGAAAQVTPTNANATDASAGWRDDSFVADSAALTLTTLGGVGAIRVQSITLTDQASGQTLTGSGAGTVSVDPEVDSCGGGGWFEYIIHNLTITLD